jgi:hypothetical protein
VGEVSIPTGDDIDVLLSGTLSNAPLLKELVAGFNCCNVRCRSEGAQYPVVVEENQLRAVNSQTILENFESDRNVSNDTMTPSCGIFNPLFSKTR